MVNYIYFTEFNACGQRFPMPPFDPHLREVYEVFGVQARRAGAGTADLFEASVTVHQVEFLSSGRRLQIPSFLAAASQRYRQLQAIAGCARQEGPRAESGHEATPRTQTTSQKRNAHRPEK